MEIRHSIPVLKLAKGAFFYLKIMYLWASLDLPKSLSKKRASGFFL
jgi:hypothetical protein